MRSRVSEVLSSVSAPGAVLGLQDHQKRIWAETTPPGNTSVVVVGVFGVTGPGVPGLPVFAHRHATGLVPVGEGILEHDEVWTFAIDQADVRKLEDDHPLLAHPNLRVNYVD